MTPPIKYRRPVQQYRFDRKGNVIIDERRLTPKFTNPAEFGYIRGDRIFEPKRSSPARLRFKAARTEARKAKSPAAVAARIAQAADRLRHKHDALTDATRTTTDAMTQLSAAMKPVNE